MDLVFDLQALKGKKILVVDDTEDNQILETRYLEMVGAEVAIASNGQEAVEMALKEKPDAVLMDLHMPILDGLNATAQLRNRGFLNPIIAVTADIQSSVRTKAFELGCNDYLSKPLSFRALLRSLKKYFQVDVKSASSKNQAADDSNSV